MKNALGWSPMSEAISYGDRQISMLSLLSAVPKRPEMFLVECHTL